MLVLQQKKSSLINFFKYSSLHEFFFNARGSVKRGCRSQSTVGFALREREFPGIVPRRLEKFRRSLIRSILRPLVNETSLGMQLASRDGYPPPFPPGPFIPDSGKVCRVPRPKISPINSRSPANRRTTVEARRAKGAANDGVTDALAGNPPPSANWSCRTG